MIKVYKEDLKDFVLQRNSDWAYTRKIDHGSYVECHYINGHVYENLMNGNYIWVAYTGKLEGEFFWVTEFTGREYLHIKIGEECQESNRVTDAEITNLQNLKKEFIKAIPSGPELTSELKDLDEMIQSIEEKRGN